MGLVRLRLYGNLAERTWTVGTEPAPELPPDATNPWMKLFDDMVEMPVELENYPKDWEQ